MEEYRMVMSVKETAREVEHCWLSNWALDLGHTTPCLSIWAEDLEQAKEIAAELPEAEEVLRRYGRFWFFLVDKHGKLREAWETQTLATNANTAAPIVRAYSLD